MIYIVFTLSAKAEGIVRFVSMTTQLPAKRLSDFKSSAKKAAKDGIMTALQCWVNSIDDLVLTPVLYTQYKQIAENVMNETFEQHIDTCWNTYIGSRSKQLKTRQGDGQVKDQSFNCLWSQNRIEAGLGTAELLSHAELRELAKRKG